MRYNRYYQLLRSLGLGGISPEENQAARRWGKHLEWPMEPRKFHEGIGISGPAG